MGKEQRVEALSTRYGNVWTALALLAANRGQ